MEGLDRQTLVEHLTEVKEKLAAIEEMEEEIT